ncbi:MAG: hypothetical protein JWN85_800 [Gammaproteobacteria bacterium]|nr:hypothetical protein [Gammaproteobacteria bacterium]
MSGQAISAQLARGEVIAEPVAVVVAHPDDEIISLGGSLARLKRLRLVHLSDGAPRDMEDAHREGFSTAREYAAARQRELYEALRVSGAAPESCSAENCPDKEVVAYLSRTTRRLADVLTQVHAVITHPYEHGHPDHDATAFAVHAACQLLRRRHTRVPPILELTSYHVRDGQIIRGEFWPDPFRHEDVNVLSHAERTLKARAVDCFVTQRAVLGEFPLAVERTRVAPLYDFTRPAPPGVAFYDLLGWSLTSEEWRRQAARASEELGLGGAF